MVVNGRSVKILNSCTGEASGDAFLMSGTKISSDDYIFESDVVYHSGQAFALLFRGQSPDSTSAYAANVDTQRKGSTARIFTFGRRNRRHRKRWKL